MQRYICKTTTQRVRSMMKKNEKKKEVETEERLVFAFGPLFVHSLYHRITTDLVIKESSRIFDFWTCWIGIESEWFDRVI